MRLSSEGTIFLSTLLLPLVLATGGCLYAQKALTVRELSAQRAALDAKAVTIKGIVTSGHIGPLLKDDSEQVAARLRFEALPPSARRERVIKDDLYRKLFDLANSIPDPDQPKVIYEVELVGLVKTLKKANYDVYKESPIEVYPLHVLRVVSVADRGSAEAKVP